MRLPIPVQKALAKLGEDIRNARRRRGIQTKIMAERVSTTRATLHKVEKGDPTVSMGTYASAFFVLGMLDRLAAVADAANDRIGMDLEEEILPQRIRYPAGGSNKAESGHE